MEYVYEVSIGVGDYGYEHAYTVEHRFPALPERDTLVALQTEAVATWEALYDMAGPSMQRVDVIYLAAEERASAPQHAQVNKP